MHAYSTHKQCAQVSMYTYRVVLCGQDASLVERCSLPSGERTGGWRFYQDHGLLLYGR